MSLKTFVTLLYLFTTTLPISHRSTNSLQVLAANAADTCNKPLRHHVLNKTVGNNESTRLNLMRNDGVDNVSHNLHEYQRDNNNYLERSSVIFGLVKLANKQNFSEKCFNDMQQIYNGIQRKEIWAMKGENCFCFS